MNRDPQIRSACSEEFERLCALFTASALDTEECARLEKHLARCEQCRAVVAEYRFLASAGMANVAAMRGIEGEERGAEQIWTDDTAEVRAKNLLLKNLKAAEAKSRSLAIQQLSGSVSRNGAGAARTIFWPLSLARLCQIAAVLVVGLAGGLTVGYEIGVQREFLGSADRSTARSHAPSEEPRGLLSQRDALNAQLAAEYANVAKLKDQAKSQERILGQVLSLKASLEQRLQMLDADDRKKTDSLESVSAQRDALQSRLEDAEQSLQNVRGDLGRLQEERQRTLLRAVSLETRIEELSTQLRESKTSAQRDEQFLASDRDIRDLIGARQLYIADVFDVDQNGQKHRPFGRVFYTKGKSLIFYAFDLDQQPGFRRAKAFQVWGSPGVDQTNAFSLGLFYLDSEANRRWVFKSDDPAVLAQVNTVFVTLEPKGESKSPSGKPILYAYLRTAPANHP